MTRYINADELRHNILYFADVKNLNGNHEQAKAYNHCLIMIDESKTVDVVKGELDEVRRECWDAGRNFAGEYQGVWVRFKDIERIIDKHLKEVGE